MTEKLAKWVVKDLRAIERALLLNNLIHWAIANLEGQYMKDFVDTVNKFKRETEEK
jgi:hypothetical protein